MCKTDELKKEYNINDQLLKIKKIKGLLKKLIEVYIIQQILWRWILFIANKCPKSNLFTETALYFHDLTDRTPIRIKLVYNSIRFKFRICKRWNMIYIY